MPRAFTTFLSALWTEITQRVFRRKEVAKLLWCVDTKRLARGKVLEIACNLGHVSMLVARAYGSEVTGIDINPSKLAYWFANWRARRLPVGSAVLLLRNGTQTGFEIGTFDRVVASHVIEHFRDPGEILREAWRVLKEDGLLVVAVPKERFLGEHHREHVFHFPDKAAFMSVLTANGFALEGEVCDTGRCMIAGFSI